MLEQYNLFTDDGVPYVKLIFTDPKLEILLAGNMWNEIVKGINKTFQSKFIDGELVLYYKDNVYSLSMDVVNRVNYYVKGGIE